MDDVRVLVVADDPLTRAGLAALLAGQPGCSVVGQVAGDVDLAVTRQVYRPDVLVWDLGWGDLTPSLERLAGLRDMPVVALVPDVDHAADVWAAGARGLLRREADAESLAAALRSVAQGLASFDPALAAALIPPQDQAPTPLAEELTPRELEVLRLLAQGLPNKAIAQRLEISEHTVKFHVNAILGKLGVQSRTEAVVHATRLGLILL